MTLRSRYIDTPLGEAIIMAEENRVVEFYFAGHRHAPGHGTDRRHAADSPVLEEAKHQIEEYFLKKRQSFRIPTNPKGTDFQHCVWETLKEIPYGETLSYQEIAFRIGKARNYARAVASAISRNPVMIFIPCHRIIGADGSLTGYAGGLDRKKALLELERRTRQEAGSPFLSS
ncbi:MAG: methylated-DNA--[protein]-cysteine S-methyltransferase [Leptospirales bacterium]